jgi:DNA-binding winged helix-turn-helix (wHTH) protein
MEHKNHSDVRLVHRNVWLSEQSQQAGVAPNQRVEMDPSLGSIQGSEHLPALEVLYSPSLRAMLESDNYQMALLPWVDGQRARGSPAESISAAARSVILPFSWKELVRRVFESLRDSYTLTEHSVARFGDVCVDFARREVRRLSGEPIKLLNQEFKTLHCFLSHPERVFSRDELLHEAWGYENYPTTRTVDNHVLRLRQKLERDPARPIHFRTIHGVGYKFVP